MKHSLDLNETLSVNIFYDLFNDEVIISEVEITEGKLTDLLQVEVEGEDSLYDFLAEKVSQELLLGFGEMDEHDEETEDYD